MARLIRELIRDRWVIATAALFVAVVVLVAVFVGWLGRDRVDLQAHIETLEVTQAGLVAQLEAVQEQLRAEGVEPVVDEPVTTDDVDGDVIVIPPSAEVMRAAVEDYCAERNGCRGESGVDGADGADGRAGIDGEDGSDGEQGGPGRPGSDGADGADGQSIQGDPGPGPTAEQFAEAFAAHCATANNCRGDPGADGIDGVDGSDGSDGVDGADGSDGADGEPGPPPSDQQVRDVISGMTFTCTRDSPLPTGSTFSCTAG